MEGELDEFSFLAELEKDFKKERKEKKTITLDEKQLPKFAVISGAPKRKRDEESDEFPRKKRKVGEGAKITAKIRIVLMFQGVPGLGKSTITPIVEKNLRRKGISCTSLCQDDFMAKASSEKDGRRDSRSAFNSILEKEEHDVIILNRNNAQYAQYKQYLKIIKDNEYKVVACFPDEIQSEFLLHFVPVMLQSVMKRSKHPTFENLDLDDKFHITLMHINSMKIARKPQVDGKFPLKWLHHKKCDTMKSDQMQFVDDILNHTRKVGWGGNPVDSDMIQQRLNLNSQDYSRWRRSKEACASSVVTGIMNFLKKEFSTFAHLYEDKPKPAAPPTMSSNNNVNTSMMNQNHNNNGGLQPPPPQFHNQGPPPPVQPQFHHPPPQQMMNQQQQQISRISQSFTPTGVFPPPPPSMHGLQPLRVPPPQQQQQFNSYPPPPRPPSQQQQQPPMRMQSFPPPEPPMMPQPPTNQQQHPPPPPGSNNRYAAFPPSRNQAQPPPQQRSFPPPQPAAGGPPPPHRVDQEFRPPNRQHRERRERNRRFDRR